MRSIDYATPARHDWSTPRAGVVQPPPAPWPPPCPVRTMVEPRHCFHAKPEGIACCACGHRLPSIEEWATLPSFDCPTAAEVAS